MQKIQRYLTNIDMVFVIALIALLPLLFLEGQQLWLKRHFQFFPIALLATALFVFFRGKTSAPLTSRRRHSGTAVFTLAMMIALVATLLFSPWLAHLAALVLVFGWLLLRCSGNMSTEVISWILPLMICLPMPSGVDGRLVRRIQILSSRSASDLLDVVGLPHLLTGNVITIKSKQLFIDEACSGVDSLYALAAVAAVIIAFNRLSLLSSVVMLISVPLWTWAGNVTRLTFIAILLERFQLDLSHGWAHDLLGLTIFGAAFLGMLAMSEMISVVLARVPLNTDESGHSGVNQFYNYLVMWPNLPVDNTQAETSPDAVIKPAEAVLPDLQQLPVSRKYAIRMAIGIVLILMISLHSWARGPVIGRIPDNTLHLEYEQVAAAFHQQDLPQNLNGMSLVDFQIEHRPNSKLFYGEYSAIWTYVRGDQQIIISLDFPFPGFHALEACYLGSGCEMIDYRKTLDVTTYARSIGTTIRSVEEVRLNHVELGECYLLYAEFDKEGRDVWRLGNRTTGSLLSRMAFAMQLQPVTFQLQLHSNNAQSLSAADRDELAKTLTDCTKLLIPKMRQFYD